MVGDRLFSLFRRHRDAGARDTKTAQGVILEPGGLAVGVRHRGGLRLLPSAAGGASRFGIGQRGGLPQGVGALHHPMGVIVHITGGLAVGVRKRGPVAVLVVAEQVSENRSVPVFTNSCETDRCTPACRYRSWEFDPALEIEDWNSRWGISLMGLGEKNLKLDKIDYSMSRQKTR